MYVKTTCQECGKIHYHYLCIGEDITISNGVVHTCINEIVVKDSCTVENLLHGILSQISDHLYNGVSRSEVEEIITHRCGIMKGHADDLIDMIEDAVGMYSPDNVHLYFV